MGKIVIEVLYPEVANLYGDLFNMKYLKQCFEVNPEVTVEWIEDELNGKPAFASRDDISVIYMGPMTEYSQELVIEKLLPYKDRINGLIEKGQLFLMTGNAMEIFEERIECEDGRNIAGLGIFPLYAKRKMFQRYNSLLLGEMENVKIVGFKSQFTHTYGNNEQEYMIQTLRGDGIHPGSKLEGMRRNNFLGTYLLGPVLVLNPELTKYVMRLCGVESPKLAFEEETVKAYQIRLKEFEDEKTTLQ